MNHHFQPSVVEVTEREEVHVLDADVGRDPSPCLPADASCCALQRKSSAAQHPCQRTRCTVVGTRVEWTATPASGRRQGQRLPKTSEEQHPELLGLERRFRRDRQAGLRETCHWPLLGTEKGLLRRCECGPDRLHQETVFHHVRSLLLPHMLACSWDAVGHGFKIWTGSPCQVPPLWGFESQFDEALSATSCSFHVRSTFTSAQRNGDEVCHIRVAIPDHVQGVGPAGPGSSWSSSDRVLQSHASQSAWKTREVQRVLVSPDVQQPEEHPRDGNVMRTGEFFLTLMGGWCGGSNSARVARRRREPTMRTGDRARLRHDPATPCVPRSLFPEW